MNLYDMLRRRDTNLTFNGAVSLAEEDIGGDRWRGVHLLAPADLTIVDARRFYSLRSQPDTCGWRVRLPEDSAFEIRFVDPATGASVSHWTHAVASIAEPVRLPWPKIPWSRFDLTLTATGSSPRPVFVGVHRALSRDWLYREATGVGLEIGPGPAPQILPGAAVRVSYVEQMPPAEWDRLYNANDRYPRRPDLWTNYVIGEAHDLPVADNSLDFIFSSHVFEHLANPLGHLEHWFRKLKPGGRMLCVIPDLMGTKDALQKPSGVEEWIEEFQQGCWTPTARHHARFYRQPADSETVMKSLRDRFSVHAHFYTNTNCQELLSLACERIGYSTFDMEWTPNSKDFHVILRKGPPSAELRPCRTGAAGLEWNARTSPCAAT